MFFFFCQLWTLFLSDFPCRVRLLYLFRRVFWKKGHFSRLLLEISLLLLRILPLCLLIFTPAQFLPFEVLNILFLIRLGFRSEFSPFSKSYILIRRSLFIFENFLCHYPMLLALWQGPFPSFRALFLHFFNFGSFLL